ncbi:MAG: HIT domain-containing protein [Candidatus Microthrix subdominans]
MTLDHLWSTWRSNYVSTLGDPPGDAEGTLFERILGAPEGDREKFIVARGRRCFALLNLFPYTAGHVMVLPNRGVAGLDDLNDEEFAELWPMVRDATVACREGLGCDAVNVGVNLGAEAGGSQSDHLHVHVVPRWAGDANFMTATADTRTLPVSLPEAWDRLRAGWPGGAPPAWMKGQAND